MNRLETKAAFEIDEAGTITGLAWPFGSPDRVGDMIEKGAFAGAIVPVPMLAHHDPTQPVGVWTSVEETDEGLAVKGRLLVEEVERSRELHALVKAGAISGLSIGFQTRKAAPRAARSGIRAGRTIAALDLVEISLVTVPAHPGARIRSTKSSGNAVALAEAIQRAATAFKLNQ